MKTAHCRTPSLAKPHREAGNLPNQCPRYTASWLSQSSIAQLGGGWGVAELPATWFDHFVAATGPRL